MQGEILLKIGGILEKLSDDITVIKENSRRQSRSPTPKSKPKTSIPKSKPKVRSRSQSRTRNAIVRSTSKTRSIYNNKKKINKNKK